MAGAVCGEQSEARFEAGSLKQLLTNPLTGRRLTGIVVRHKSEWSVGQAGKFEELKALIRKHKCAEEAERLGKRIADLGIRLKGEGFDSEREAYYFHPLGVIGWLTASVGEFDWFETPLVKLIVSKESKSSFNAYNITGWDEKGRNRVYESHFQPTAQYHLEKMTIAEIRRAQTTHVGPNKKHLFAVGIFQMIPDTLFGRFPTDRYFMKWVNNYRKVDESNQLFDKNFQQLTLLYFWEEKKSKISQYFKGNETVTNAAYAVAQEWASAGVPKGLPIMKKKGQDKAKISDGNISFYDSDGLNKAHYPADKTIEALEATKKMIDAAGGYDSVRNETLSILNK
ncbi:type IV secretion protein Rhs [Aggregatibacter actinomycetemcomitans]|uniref:type IV secretion protein Rhs n=1 Tax=Aggregatibacter actinomycetemcomitans TaxID=714 RepID=UPI00211F1676|nr:type IV secretion protein Rhs [Aggregatibacter actinomycetemcomitans]